MTPGLVRGDQVSCSRVGGTMRRESARLRLHAQLLVEAMGDLPSSEMLDSDSSMPDMPDMTAMPDLGPSASMVPGSRVTSLARTLLAIADDLDVAGAALQRYATDLAEAHELGRRAERRVQGAGLLLEGTRVSEPWGPASTQEAERRRAELPEVQSRVFLATACVGRARGRLEREVARLAHRFSTHARESNPTHRAPLPPRRS